MKIFLVLLFIFLFLPIPLKISIYYSEENYYIKIFNINILKRSEKKAKDIKLNQEIKRKKINKKALLEIYPPRAIIKALDNSKFKPFLWLKGSLSYSFSDSAITAVSYGLLSSLFPLLLRIVKIFFNTRKITLPIKPLFKDKLLANIEIKCIICFSFVQIIFMIFLIFKEIILEKEAKPLKGEI